MRILKISLLIILFFPSFSFAEKIQSTPFDATIILVESLNKIWIQLENKKDYDIFSKNIPTRNKRERHLAMPIYLYGISKKDMSEVENRDKDKSFKAFLLMKEVLKEKKSVVRCLERDQREGIYYCIAKVNGVDIGKEIISSGYSRFENYNFKTDHKIEADYEKSEDQAQQSKLGIWEPYYTLFN